MVLKNMVNLQMMIVVLVILGFFIRRKGIVSTEGRKNMIDLSLSVTLPFNILHSFFMEWDWGMLHAFGMAFLLSLLYNAVGVTMSFLLYRKEPQEKQKALRYGTIVSNGGFLGNPVIEGIYGSEGLLYASVFMVPVRIVMWSIGLSVFLSDRDKKKKGALLKKVLTNPCIIAVYVGVFLMGTGLALRLPVFLQKTVSGISGCNTPLSMMLVGMMLAEMNPRGFLDRTVAGYTALRLIVIPGIVYLLTAFWTIDPLLRGIAVIIAAMPTSISTVLLSSKHGGDERCAAGMVFTTTLLSLVTLPLWCVLL